MTSPQKYRNGEETNDENNKATLFDYYSGETIKEIANVSSISGVAYSLDYKALKVNA